MLNGRVVSDQRAGDCLWSGLRDSETRSDCTSNMPRGVLLIATARHSQNGPFVPHPRVIQS